MMKTIHKALLILVCIFLAACDGPEDRTAAQFETAEQLHSAGDLEKARDEYLGILEIEPENLRARYRLGLILEKLQDNRGAMQQYNAILDRDDNHVDARLRLAQLYLLVQQTDQAMEHADMALSANPDNADVLALRGMIFLRRQDIESAMRDVVRALEVDPDNVNAILLKATLLNSNGNTGEAVELLTGAIEKHPDNVLLRRSLASIYISAGDHESALEQLNTLVEQQPGVLLHRLRLADVYYIMNNPEQAESVIRKAISDFPDNDRVKLSLVRFIAGQSGNEAALDEMQRFISEQPDNHTLRFALAKMHQQLGQSGDAIGIYEEVIAREGLEPDGLTARVQLAELYSKVGRNAEAMPLLTEVLTASPDNRAALALRGSIYLSEQNAPAAIADLRAAIRDAEDSTPLWLNLARAYVVNNELDQAVETMKHAVSLQPNDLNLREEYIRLLALMDDREAVIAQLDEVLKISPDNLVAMEALFRVHAAGKDWEALKQVTNRMKTAHPDKALGFYYSGLTLREQGLVEESVAEFERAVELAPEEIEPITQLVRTWMLLDQPDLALARINEILAGDEDNLFARNLLGEIYLFKKELDPAIEAFEKAIRIRPDWQLPYRNLANSYLLKNENDRAVEAYRRGIDAIGFSPLLVTDLARFFEATGDVDRAIELYEEVLVQDADNSLAANNLAMLLIDYRGDDQSLKRAEVLVENLKNVNNPAYLDTIGWLYYKQGEVDAAIPLLEQAVAASPDNVGFNYHLGMAHAKAGNTAAARDALTKATNTNQRYLGIDEARETLESL
jgi:tetratricopeptide (TPR) repeat protein